MHRRRILAMARLLAFAVILCTLGSCKREAPAPPPPTPERVKAGVEATVERIRKDPNMTPQQKEQAIRALYGMAGGIRTQGSGKP